MEQPARCQPKAGKVGEGGPPSGEAIVSARGVLDRLEGAFTQLKNAGGINVTGAKPEANALAWAYENVPLAERIGNSQGFSARQDIDGLLTQGVFSLIPLLTGAKLGGKAFDAKAEMDNLKTSLASAKDYDSAMRSIRAFRAKIDRLEFGSSSSSAPRRIRPNTPKGGGKSTSGWRIIS